MTEEKERLVSARDFVTAGGSVSLSEWANLSDEERGAMVKAGIERDELFADMVVSRLVEVARDASELIRLSTLLRKAEAQLEGEP